MHTAPSVYTLYYVSSTRLLTAGRAFLAREHQFHFIHVGRTDFHYSHETRIVYQVNALLLDPP